MYKILKIGGREYKLEYTVEASLYDDCIEKVMNYLGNTVGAAEHMKESVHKQSEEENKKMLIQIGKSIKNEMVNLPRTSITVFYAGLLEHHGVTGDRTILSVEDVKPIVKQFFDEHEEDGTGNFYDLLAICFDQMREDGFFEKIGLGQMAKAAQPHPINRAQRRATKKATGK